MPLFVGVSFRNTAALPQDPVQKPGSFLSLTISLQSLIAFFTTAIVEGAYPYSIFRRETLHHQDNLPFRRGAHAHDHSVLDGKKTRPEGPHRLSGPVSFSSLAVDVAEVNGPTPDRDFAYGRLAAVVATMLDTSILSAFHLG